MPTDPRRRTPANPGRWRAANPSGVLTTAFSKKLENLEHSIALHFFMYNFIMRHVTLRMPPALKAHVTDYVWTFEELVDLIDRAEAQQFASD